MEAPERIWLDWPDANKGDVVYDEPPERDTQPGQTGYVRADIHATLAARLAEVERDLEKAWASRERTADERDEAIKLSTANALRIAVAEARAERLGAALRVIADGQGRCGSCGKLAEGEGSGVVGCDGKRDADYNPHYDCVWEPLDVEEFARAAQEGGE